MNIPIYRAKKINSDEYIEGYLIINKYNTKTEYIINCKYDSSTIFGELEIDPATLSIHFPDMIDSQGNKIFASLSEDGKGGDLLEHTNMLTGDKMLLIASYHQAKGEFGAYSNTHYIRSMKFHLTKIVGVQK